MNLRVHLKTIGLPEAVLTVVAVVLVVFVAYFVHHNEQQANATLQAATRDSQIAHPTSTQTAPVIPVIVAPAINIAQSFAIMPAYNAYLAKVSTGGSRIASLKAVKAHLNPSLYQKILADYKIVNNHDEVLCSAMLPARIVLTQGATAAGETKVSVGETIGQQVITVVTNVNAVTKKIDSITCPAS